MPQMEVTCRCGWTSRGSERQVIERIRSHARADHALEMSPDDVRAIWRIVDEAPPSTRKRGTR